MNEKKYVFGKTTTKLTYVISQSRPFIQNEYLIIEDSVHGNIPVEVIETNTYPMVVSSILPQGCAIEFLKCFGFHEEKMTYMAKAKALIDLNSPISPNSEARKPKFKEVESLLINAKLPDGMVLGVIKGTEQMQEDLPEYLENVAPLWKDGRAIKQCGVPFILNHHKFRENPHIGLFGTTGSGKSVGLRDLCEEIMQINAPGIAFDPHFELVFNEYMDGLENKHKIDFSDKHEIFKIGKNVGINFFELTLEELVHLINCVGKVSDPQKSALEVLFETGDTIEHLKNKIVDLKIAFENEEKPQRERVDLTSQQAMIYAKCKNSVSGSNTLQALAWKIDALKATKIFQGNLDGVERAMKQGKLAIIQGDQKRSQMIASHIIKKLYHKRKHYQDFKEGEVENKPDYFPMFFTIIDEAQNYCPKEGSNPAKAILTTIAQEARKYGVFEILCTQKPGALDPNIFAQLNTKIIFRIKATDDMVTISKETNLTEEEAKTLPDLPSGHCFISSATLTKTFPVRFRTSFTKSPHTIDPFKELNQYLKEMQVSDISEILLNFLPLKATKISCVHSDIIKAVGKEVGVIEIIETLEKMVKVGRITAKKTPFGSEYINNL